MAKINKRFYNAGCNKKLCQLLTKLTKFVSINQRNNRPGGSGGQEHVEEGCYSSFRSQRGSVSQVVVCCEKERWRNWPIVNLNDLNTNIPYQHFRMEGFLLLKEILLTGGKMCKIDFKDSYFQITRSVKSSKYVRFQSIGLLYEFCCLCFGLFPDPLVFTRLFEVPISLLRRLCVRIIIYTNDMLVMTSSLEDQFMARDTLIFILRHFLINIKKSYRESTMALEFLRMMVHYGE